MVWVCLTEQSELLPEWPIFLNLFSLSRKAHRIMHPHSPTGTEQLFKSDSKLEGCGCPALSEKATTSGTMFCLMH